MNVFGENLKGFGQYIEERYIFDLCLKVLSQSQISQVTVLTGSKKLCDAIKTMEEMDSFDKQHINICQIGQVDFRNISTDVGNSGSDNFPINVFFKHN
jgi:hypothetical protein